MLRQFDAADVRILDGGLPAWIGAGFSTEAGHVHPAAAAFHVSGRPSVYDMDQVVAALRSRAETVVDARSAARFRGEAPEPRPGLPSGHMPGARNLPFDRLVGSDGRLLAPDHIRREFDEAGVDLSRPVVTTCGSGVTAAVLAFALASLGKQDVSLYDGSWAEWAAQPGNPVASGPA
jgi:thiosulfate/3-mercaptopyruvate sulfurtransferase